MTGMLDERIGRAAFDAWLLSRGENNVYHLAPGAIDGPWFRLSNDERKAWTDAAVEAACWAHRQAKAQASGQPSFV